MRAAANAGDNTSQAKIETQAANRLNVRQRSEAEARRDNWMDNVEELWRRGDLSQLSVEQLRATLRRKGLGVRSAVTKPELLQRLGAILHKEDPEIRRRLDTERQAQDDSLIQEAKECWQRRELSKLSNKQLQAALRCMGSRPGSGRKVELL